MTTNEPDYVRKVKALLERADNASTDAEAELCRQRAFAIMAKHGIDEAMARDHGTDPIDTHVFTCKGGNVYAYRDLVCYVGEALHCQPVYRLYRQYRDPVTNRTGMFMRVTVFGRRSHLARLQLVVPHLWVQLQRETARAHHGGQSLYGLTGAERAAYTRNWRKSFATGWAGQVGIRLAEQEKVAGREYQGRADLVLQSDREKAAAAMRAALPNTKDGKTSNVNRNALVAGAAKGQTADLGNGALAGRKALGR